MTLYEIDAAIMACVDAETGEILDCDALDALQMEREAKIESLCLWVKNLKAEAAAIKAEEQNLAKRRKAAENRAESLRQYVASALAGEKLKTPRVSVSYRATESVNVTDLDKLCAIHPNFIRNNPEPDKTAIKAAIKSGATVQGAELVSNTSTIIK